MNQRTALPETNMGIDLWASHIELAHPLMNFDVRLCLC